MKTIYLHIGCGKTGSSAIQVWLNNNASSFEKNGYYYPSFGTPTLDTYAITSGNGVHLLNAIRQQSIPHFLDGIFKECFTKIIFSSEAFQSLTPDEAIYFVKLCKELQIRIKIIAYVRDAYDMAYSGYLQLIKRHTYDASFREFALGRTNEYQFNIIQLYEKHFSNINLIHYDSAYQHGIDISFCEALGIPFRSVPPMSKKTVNRSLTVYESQLMLLANKAYKEHYNHEGVEFSSAISDLLIATEPEKKTELLYLPDVEEHLHGALSKHIEHINRNYLEATSIQIFNPSGKNLVQSITEIDPTLKMFIRGVVKSLCQNNNSSVSHAI